MQEKRVILEQLGQIIPDHYDKPICCEDRISFQDEQLLSKWPDSARHTGPGDTEEPLAVIVMKFQAVSGYNGNITLLDGHQF